METPLMRTFKSLHEKISIHTDLDGLDPMEYFAPFLDLVEDPLTRIIHIVHLSLPGHIK